MDASEDSEHETMERALKRRRLEEETSAVAAAAGTAKSPLPPPYHDVTLTNYTHLLLRVHILPNAWLCYKMYAKDGHVMKQTSFLFPRIRQEAYDAATKAAVYEWNGPDAAKNYDCLSIAMVLAELEGDEARLRQLEEIHIEGRVERVVKLLQSKH